MVNHFEMQPIEYGISASVHTEYGTTTVSLRVPQKYVSLSLEETQQLITSLTKLLLDEAAKVAKQANETKKK